MRTKAKIEIIMTVALIALSGVAQALDGTWTNLTSGLNWSTAGNWTGGTVATGTNYKAYFDTLDITGTVQVNLDKGYTIGSLYFGDTGTGTAGSWLLDSPTSILTLGNGGHVIGVSNTTATINAKIAGTVGLIKEGNGTLTLTYATNTYTGNTLINAGTLDLSAGGAKVIVSTNITVANGGTLLLSTNYSTVGIAAVGTSLIVQNGGTVNMQKYFSSKGYLQLDTGASMLASGAGITQGFVMGGTNTATQSSVTIGSVNIADDGPSVIIRADQLSSPTMGLKFDGTDNGSGAKISKLTLSSGANTQISTGDFTYILDIGDSTAAANDLEVTTLTLSKGTNDTWLSGKVIKQGAGTMLDAGNLAGTPASFDMEVNEGTMIFGGTANLKSMTVGSSGTLQLGNNGAGGSSTTAINNNGTLTFKRATDYTHAANITGSGVVNKSGTNTLTFTGAKTYTNTTTVSEGKLVVNGSLLSQQISVLSGAALGGSGTVQKVTLDAGAILSAGNSPGTMTFAGDLLLSAGSTNIMEIYTSGFDVLMGSVTNTLTMSGETLFDFTGNTVTNGSTFAVLQNWDSITTDGTTTFSVIGLGVDQSLDYSQITSGLVTVIPEPATIGMLGLGALITILLRRTRTI